MVLKSSIAIYREVAKQLAPKLTPKTEKDALKVIENAITTSKTMTLLVLDEVDQLDSKNQSVLYTVFEWPALQSSTLALVGIANSLDLTNRVLPRLQVSPAYKPTLLHYPPYTKHQIIDILSARLKEGGETVQVKEGGATLYMKERGETVQVKERGESVTVKEGGETVQVKDGGEIV